MEELSIKSANLVDSMNTATIAQSAHALMAVACAKAVRPLERLSVSQWADRHRILTSKQSGETGRWRTSRNPMLREIMDCLSAHSNVREIWIMKSSQVGVTETIVNWIGYIIAQVHYALMVLMPTLESRDTWKVQKLNPLLQETPIIRDILGGLRSRDAANSKETIDFPGGIMFLAGGNSPNSYSQKSVRWLVMDDLDRFPSEIGDEGDPVELARSRVKAFIRHKLLFASTPTLKGASLIERGFLSGDQRRYHVECPHCHERLVLRWSNVRANTQLTEAHYVCEHNGCIIQEHYKPQMLARGEWIPDVPENKVRSYHISAIYAPIGLGPSWLELVIKFKRVHKDPTQLKTFLNQELGEPWEDQSDKLKPNELAKRAGGYAQGEIPPGCLALTIGLDTQDTWIEATLLGWGANEKHWIIERIQFTGDTTKPEVWNEVEAWLHTVRVNSYGKEMRPRVAGIDSRGHRTEQVKEFVMRTTLRIPVYSVQGSTTRMGRAIAQSGSYPNKNSKGKTIKYGYCVWNVGTEHCKDYIFAHLAADGERAESERVFNFPVGMDDEYYDGLLSEVYDPDKKRYVQRLGAKYKRNEPLDTLVYAWAIGQHRDVMLGRGRTGRPDPKYWERLEVMLEGGEKIEVYAKTEDERPVQPPARKPKAQSFSRRRVISRGAR